MKSLVLALLAGCNTYVAVGMDTGHSVGGNLGKALNQSVSSDARVQAANAAAGVETVDPGAPAGNTYSLQLGWRMSSFAIGFDVQAHDADKSTFSTSMTAGAPRYAAATGALDLSWKPIGFSIFSTYVHAGPAMGALLERSSGDYQVGKGLRFGGGLMIDLKVATAFVDLYQTELIFSEGAAQGSSAIKGATIGIGFNR